MITDCLRCVVKYNLEEHRMHIWMEERKSFLFITWWVKVDRGFYVAPYARMWADESGFEFIRNPMIMSFEGGMKEELYINGTFDLRKRVKEYSLQYQEQRSRNQDIKRKLINEYQRQ